MDLLSFDIGLAVGVLIVFAGVLLGMKLSEKLERRR